MAEGNTRERHKGDGVAMGSLRPQSGSFGRQPVRFFIRQFQVNITRGLQLLAAPVDRFKTTNLRPPW